MLLGNLEMITFVLAVSAGFAELASVFQSCNESETLTKKLLKEDLLDLHRRFKGACSK